VLSHYFSITYQDLTKKVHCSIFVVLLNYIINKRKVKTMERITEKMLESLVLRLNSITGSPETSYTKIGDKFIANIGNYHISGAYGGVQLQRMVGESGGVQTPLGGGYCSKRELYEKIHAYISGIESTKNNNQ
jgi:hypothetical protein